MLSLLLGLIAWGLATLGIIKILRRKTVFTPTKIQLVMLSSMTLCAFAIWLEYRYQLTRLEMGDYSAMLDIMPSSVNAALMLLIVSLILNSSLVILSHRHMAK